jgi:ribosomal-protein-alanine N-acetyltransferase
VNTFSSDILAIRRCVASDLDRVSAIERSSFSDPWSFETFSAALALPHLRFLVAEEAVGPVERGGGEPRLVGYVVALVMADEAEIADVAVEPSARRRGVARVLLERISADAAEAGVRALYLEVRESNSAARGLYHSLGFTQVGLRRGYYQHPSEDALLLRRDLAPT